LHKNCEHTTYILVVYCDGEISDEEAKGKRKASPEIGRGRRETNEDVHRCTDIHNRVHKISS